MKKQGLFVLGIALLSQGCVQVAEAPIRLDFQLDPELDSATQTQITTDLKRLVELQVQAKDGSLYDAAFGGTTQANTLNYLNERVHYLIPESADLDTRLVVLGDDQSGAPSQGQGKIYTMATNIGTLLWFESILEQPKEIGFTIGTKNVPVTDSRVGVVRIGEGWTAKDEHGESLFPQLLRLTTLVHEARHSDCTGGLLASDLKKISTGDLPEHRECGHLHVQCPADHPYAGAYACDAEAWGAYSIEAIYSGTLSQNCTNCTEEEKKIGTIVAADSLSRVLVLDDMLAGKLGKPDMSSSTDIK